MKIQWDHALTCFVEAIDEQHKELISHFSDYIEAFNEEGTKPKIKDMLVFLHHYIKEHFATEEQLMEQNQYPHFEDHAISHKEYVDAYKKLIRDYRQDHDIAELKKTLASMLDWFLKHIREYDIPLGQFLKTCESAQETVSEMNIPNSAEPHEIENLSGIRWTQAYSCFVQFIDEQHQTLIGRFSNYLTAFQENKEDSEVREMLVFLQNYVVEHFKAEEVQMKKLGYPRFSEHKIAHEEYIEDYKKMLTRYKQDLDISELQNKTAFMLEWFMNHIKDHDIRMGFFVKNTMLLRYNKKHLLLVSDHAELWEQMKDVFMSLGYDKIVEAKDKKEVWEWVKMGTILILAIAIHKDEDRAIDILRTIRSHTDDFPILLLTHEENKLKLNANIRKNELYSSSNFLVPRPVSANNLVHILNSTLFKHHQAAMEV
ncbi:MAG: bacteriohemerythrin [SAR324 cluster bacterium]|nr:bacteriohemerythrin [SAR324 cluster bacterium]